MSSPGDQVVREFEVERAGIVRASVGRFRGRDRIDIRLWVEPRDSPGADLIPTRQGINLPIEYLAELQQSIEALASATPRTQDRPARSRQAA